MKNRLFIGLMLFAVLITAACCKDKKCSDPANPDCENYDVCYGKKATSAAFKILETSNDPDVEEVWQDYETDTIIGGLASFVALDSVDAEYLWEIGAATYKTRKVTLSFSSVRDSSIIPIKLFIKKKSVDKSCFPLDKGVDSITRNMYIIRRSLVMSPWETFTYRGSNTDKPNDIFDLKFYYDTIPFSGNATIEGLIPNKGGIRADGRNSRRQFAFIMRDGIRAIGSAFLKQNDSITVKYTYGTSVTPNITKTFLGKKIK